MKSVVKTFLLTGALLLSSASAHAAPTCQQTTPLPLNVRYRPHVMPRDTIAHSSIGSYFLFGPGMTKYSSLKILAYSVNGKLVASFVRPRRLPFPIVSGPIAPVLLRQL